MQLNNAFGAVKQKISTPDIHSRRTFFDRPAGIADSSRQSPKDSPLRATLERLPGRRGPSARSWRSPTQPDGLEGHGPRATSCVLVVLLAGHAGLSFQRSSAKGDGLR
jgi:hypothetical protein